MFPAKITRCLLLGLGGFLIGFGTRMGGGCTSGHGICGHCQFIDSFPVRHADLYDGRHDDRLYYSP